MKDLHRDDPYTFSPIIKELRAIGEALKLADEEAD